MADQTYSLEWIISPGKAVSGAQQIAHALTDLEKAIDRVGPKLKSLGAGASAPLNNAGTAAGKLATNLGQVGTAAGTAGAALKGVGTSAGGVSAPVGKATASVAGFAAGALALNAARVAIGAFVEESAKLEQQWKKMAEEASAFRESVRELANIKGQSGPSNKVIGDVLDLSLDTGMTPDKAREFSQSYENIGPAVREKGHYKPAKGTAEGLEKEILTDTAVTARRIGLDEQVAGEAIGSAGMFHTFHSADEARAVFGGAQEGLSKGKLDYRRGFTALNKAAAKLVDADDAKAEGAKAGNIGGFDEAGVYMGAMSLGTGTAEQAQHRMVQVSRVLNTLDPTGQEALKKAGITDRMTDPEKLVQLDKYLTAEKVGDRKKWLAENKLASKAERESVVAAMKQGPILEQRLAEMRRDRASGATARRLKADNDQFMATDRTAAAGRAGAIEQANDIVEGEGFEQFETAKRMAEQRERVMHPGQYNSTMWNVGKRVAGVITQLHRGVGGTTNYNETGGDTGAIPTLKAQARKVGVDVETQFPDVDSNDYRTRARAFGNAADAVRKKGGDPYGQAELLKGTRRGVESLRKGNGAAGGGPAPQANNGGDLKGAAAELKAAARALAAAGGRGGGGGQVAARGPAAAAGDYGGGFGPLRA